jgi:hypothetical protein
MRQTIRDGDHCRPTFAGPPFPKSLTSKVPLCGFGGRIPEDATGSSNTTKRFLFTLALLWCAPLPVLAQAPTGVAPQVDARAEVAAALYAASATQAASERLADAKMLAPV